MPSYALSQTKIDRLKELISEEQRTMDGNVDEYLKLSQQAEDRQQQARIKQLFEKKNQVPSLSKVSSNICTGSRLGQNLSIPDFSLDSEFGHRM